MFKSTAGRHFENENIAVSWKVYHVSTAVPFRQIIEKT